MDRSPVDDEAARLKAYLAAPVVKRSVTVSGHATSVSLEQPFWDALQSIAKDRDLSLNALISEIDNIREGTTLSSALRLYVLKNLTQ